MQLNKEVAEQAKANPKLQAQADAVNAALEEYKAILIPEGRTLAEIINQPAKLFSKLVWLHNMMESTEGPPNNTSVKQLEDIEALLASAEAKEGEAFRTALAAFNAAAQ